MLECEQLFSRERIHCIDLDDGELWGNLRHLRDADTLSPFPFAFCDANPTRSITWFRLNLLVFLKGKPGAPGETQMGSLAVPLLIYAGL